jgi:hypothetical protein
VSLDGDAETDVPQARHMARFTPDDLRHPPSAAVDASAGGYAPRATRDHAEQPVRHLVIFPQISRYSALRPFRPAV